MSDHKLLPDDPFDQALARLIGLPNGAHTGAVVRQAMDFYGKTTQYVIQTVRTDEGDTTFVTQINAHEGARRYILPPAILDTIDRQRGAVATMVKRRHGKRLAEERRAAGVDLGAHLRDPEVRKRAAAARAAKAAKKRARRRGGTE